MHWQGKGKATSAMDDPFTLLNIVRNPDGSLTRPNIFPLLHPTTQSRDPIQTHQHNVQSKDVPLNPSTNTWIRLFRPCLSTPPEPLPIIIYFHGGGFVFLSADCAPIHQTCERMANRFPSVVVSVNYRLAPEHPLPAAYADAMDAMRWVQHQALSTADAWMAPNVANFSRCFLMGSSAGGNIAYHASLKALDVDYFPVRIVGVILDQPFFGGGERTESELSLVKDEILPLYATDLLWKLALPSGADREHEFCNPISDAACEKEKEEEEERARRLPACMVWGTKGDPLVDRQREVVKALRGRGAKVVGCFEEEGCHGVHFFELDKAEVFLTDVKDFISGVLRS